MKRRLSPLVLAVSCVLLPCLVSSSALAQELRVLAHNSFSLPKPLLAQFEPASFDSISAETIAEKGAEWVSRWTKVVLK